MIRKKVNIRLLTIYIDRKSLSIPKKKKKYSSLKRAKKIKN